MSTKKGMKLNKTRRGGPRTFSTPEEMSKDVYAMNARRTNDSGDEHEEQGRVRHANPAQAVMEIRNPNSGGQLMPEQSDSEEEDEDQELESEPANRKEREARQKEQARERHLQLTAEGKTDQARADLARLAIIRKQREDAKKKKEEAAVESLAKKNQSLAAGKSLIGKTLGKK